MNIFDRLDNAFNSINQRQFDTLLLELTPAGLSEYLSREIKNHDIFLYFWTFEVSYAEIAGEALAAQSLDCVNKDDWNTKTLGELFGAKYDPSNHIKNFIEYQKSKELKT
jgi:hypothetical protein